MSTLFTKLIQGKLPCHKLYEDDMFFSFLDISPISEGHTLLIPKQEVDYFFDQSHDELSEILLVSKYIASALKKAVPCKRVGILVAGLEVPHAHLHLVPITHTSQLSFEHAKAEDDKQLQETAKKIRAHL